MLVSTSSIISFCQPRRRLNRITNISFEQRTLAEHICHLECLLLNLTFAITWSYSKQTVQSTENWKYALHYNLLFTVNSCIFRCDLHWVRAWEPESMFESREVKSKQNHKWVLFALINTSAHEYSAFCNWCKRFEQMTVLRWKLEFPPVDLIAKQGDQWWTSWMASGNTSPVELILRFPSGLSGSSRSQ